MIGDITAPGGQAMCSHDSTRVLCSSVNSSSMESFTAEQKEYLERRFLQLTAAMVRPTTIDQAPASGSSADIPAQGDNGKHIY